MQRWLRIGEWIFEVKTVRAQRINALGQPYSAMANIQFNGDKVYVDGLLTAEEQDFDRKDFESFKHFCQQLEVKQVQFDRYKNMISHARELDVPIADKCFIAKVVNA